MEPAGSNARVSGWVDWRRGQRLALWALAPFIWIAMMTAPGVFAAPDEGSANATPFNIAVFINSRSTQCFDSGNAAAITRLAKEARDQVNEAGGIAGRRLNLQFLDDKGDAKQSIVNVKAALSDPQTIAMIGLTNPDRAKEVFDTAGTEIRNSGVPFISNIAVSSIFANYPNVFSMRASQDDDNVPVLSRFTKDLAFRRPAFIGLKEQLSSSAFGDGLKERLEAPGFIADYRLTITDNKLDPAEIAAAIDDLKAKNPDFVIMSVGGSRSANVLNAMSKAGIEPPVFVTGRIETMLESEGFSYSGDLYQLSWDGVPDAFNDRLRKRISLSDPHRWVFEGRRNSDAPGWKSGECKEQRKQTPSASALSNANLRAVATGAQYADMVALIAKAAQSAGPSAGAAALHTQVIKTLATDFASGRGTFPGTMENWSFRAASRTAARTPFILMRPKGQRAIQLAPIQYVGLKNDALRQIRTLYLDIDLTRAFRVDDNEKSFAAEFYISMHEGKGQSIDQIEFANAFIEPSNNQRQLNIRTVNEGGKSVVYPDGMKIYAVSGKFMFEPHFMDYPFDTQRFAIDLRPKDGNAPFIVQAPPPHLRDRQVATDGWRVSQDYVGYDEDFLPIIDAMTHDQSVVPFYKGSFVWVMQRQATDYFLRVVIPLMFIMGIAYLAIFIPNTHFEAIVTIQVTALLSAVALYLTIPKVDSDVATLSDRIFLFDYMIVSLMIFISILRVNRRLERAHRVRDALWYFHVIFIPVMAALMGVYVMSSNLASGEPAVASLPGLRSAFGY